MKLILFLIFASAKAYSYTRTYDSVSYHEGQVAYVEKHHEVLNQGKVESRQAIFYTTEGKVIGTMICEFDHSPEASHYIMRDRRHGYIQGIRWHNKRLQTFVQSFKEKKAQIEDVVTLEKLPIITAPGLSTYILENLDHVVHQKVVPFQFVIPGRGQAFDLNLILLSIKSEIVEFEVSMGEWPVNLIGPRMKFIFDRSQGRLLFYRGPSEIRNVDGQMMMVETEYYYPN